MQDDPATLRTEAIRSNRGQPISRFEQGKIYAAMREGTQSEDQPVGAAILAPMTLEAIADEVGYSKAHVHQCLCIFESPESVRVLLEDEKVSPDAVLEAGKLAKDKDGELDEAKLLKVLKAAMGAADEEGKATATKKHVVAVKDKFAPKLVAERPHAAASVKKTDEPKYDAGDESDTGEESEEPSEQAESVMDFGTTEAAAPTKKEIKTAKETFAAVYAKWGEETSNSAYSDEDLELLFEAITEAGFRLAQSPI